MKGAYGQQAMEGYFGTEIDSFDVPTFKEAVAAVSSGQAEYGVLPIENSSTGSITDVYDLLSANDNYIVGEYILNIEHALLGYPGAKIEDIRTVYFPIRRGCFSAGSFLEAMTGKASVWRIRRSQPKRFWMIKM